MRSIVVHYQEIALKGRNRPWFIERLVRHIRAALTDLDVRRVQAVDGTRRGRARSERADGTPSAHRLAQVFGIANFSRAGRTSAPISTC